MKTPKVPKQERIMSILFSLLCVFSLLGVYSSLCVSRSSFSDTESIVTRFFQEPAGCVHGAGFWRNHPGNWPVEDITVGGVVYTKALAISLMSTPGPGDKTYDVFRQLVASRLNLFSGCSVACVAEAVASADQWLISHPLGSGIQAQDAAWHLVKPWVDTLEQYNSGLLCRHSWDQSEKPAETPGEQHSSSSADQEAMLIRDDSPRVAEANTTYLFRVETNNSSMVLEILVQYWYPDDAAEHLRLSCINRTWTGSFMPLDTACFVYRLVFLDSTGVWHTTEDQTITITTEQEGER